jgi:fatty acid CoA ligase FadD9
MHPQQPTRRSVAPVTQFRSATHEAKIGLNKDVPHITTPVIVKYITDLQLLGML